MLSLSNAFNQSDMINFLKKDKKFLNQNQINIDLFCEPKIDGISATLIYEKGRLIKVYRVETVRLERIYLKI